MFHLKEGIGEIRGIVLKGRRQDLPAVSRKELEQCKMYRNIQEGQSTMATVLPQQARQRKLLCPHRGLSISKQINQGIPDLNVRHSTATSKYLPAASAALRQHRACSDSHLCLRQEAAAFVLTVLSMGRASCQNAAFNFSFGASASAQCKPSFTSLKFCMTAVIHKVTNNFRYCPSP